MATLGVWPCGKVTHCWVCMWESFVSNNYSRIKKYSPCTFTSRSPLVNIITHFYLRTVYVNNYKHGNAAKLMLYLSLYFWIRENTVSKYSRGTGTGKWLAYFSVTLQPTRVKSDALWRKNMTWTTSDVGFQLYSSSKSVWHTTSLSGQVFMFASYTAWIDYSANWV